MQQTALPIISNREQPGVTNIGGILQIRSARQMLEDEKASAEQDNTQPVISGLAAHIRKCWSEARDAKEQSVEEDMLEAIRQRRGEYSPAVLQQLKRQGSSVVYMMVTANKCRSAASWLREALGGMPWKASPTPVADVDEETYSGIVRESSNVFAQAMMAGTPFTPSQAKEFMLAVRDEAFRQIQETAKARAERMTEKMKDQMIEGGFPEAMDAFIDDLVTFPAAFLKGPTVRKRPTLKWVKEQSGQEVVDEYGNVLARQEQAPAYSIDVEEAFRLEWNRVDPFNVYPAPDATNVDDGYLIERHRLSRADLVALRDVEGYSSAAINAVLDEYGRGGLHEWLSVDSSRLTPEGKPTMANDNPSELIDALQFWGSVQGKMLIEWGVPEEEVQDPLDEYHIEAWLIGNWVIKATVNPDPLHRKPYYKASWEQVPGSFWGRGIPALCADCQRVCNAAARALVNNMGLSSGPQVAYDISKLPVGADLTEIYPWKIWQFKSDSFSTNATMQPISFFQPNSNAAELMGIYEKFATLADEYTGIPRYMAGSANVGGAASTASGMSMLMSNAGKSIKNVVATVDRILKPAIERLYMYNMMYLDDIELKGDVNIQVEGTDSLIKSSQQQQKLNECIIAATSNPVINQLIGPEGIAYLVREWVKQLGMDTDKIVPAPAILKARMQQQQMQQALAMQQAMAAQKMGQPQAGGSQAAPETGFDQRRLMNGEPQSITEGQKPRKSAAPV